MNGTKQKICKFCKEEFFKKKESKPQFAKRLFCSKMCFSKNCIKENDPIREKTSKACIICGIKFVKSTKDSWERYKERKFCGRKCVGKYFGQENSPKWKGDGVGYTGVHLWMRKKYGDPTTCQNCRATGLRGMKIHWANISGQYKRDFVDWIRLCVPCHRLFDYQNVNAYIARRPTIQTHDQ